MTMKTRNIQILIIGLILVSFLTGAYLYTYMPEKMASHWDANGGVNGYMPKLLGLFLLPVISAILFLAFMPFQRSIPSKQISRSSEGILICSYCCSSYSCSTFTC